jgi:hypothetical protein
MLFISLKKTFKSLYTYYVLAMKKINLKTNINLSAEKEKLEKKNLFVCI